MLFQLPYPLAAAGDSKERVEEEAPLDINVPIQYGLLQHSLLLTIIHNW